MRPEGISTSGHDRATNEVHITLRGVELLLELQNTSHSKELHPKEQILTLSLAAKMVTCGTTCGCRFSITCSSVAGGDHHIAKPREGIDGHPERQNLIKNPAKEKRRFNRTCVLSVNKVNIPVYKAIRDKIGPIIAG